MEWDHTKAAGRLRAGDRDYLAKVFRQYSRRVKRYIQQVGWHIDDADADDLTQQVFYKLASDLLIKPWLMFSDDIKDLLCRSARTLVLNEARRRSRAGRMTEELAREPVRLPPRPDEELHDKENVTLLCNTVAVLPEKCREPADRVIIREETLEEAAESTGLAVGTVKTRMTRARALMFKAYTARKELRHEQEPESDRNVVPAERAADGGAGHEAVRPRGRRKAAS